MAIISYLSVLSAVRTSVTANQKPQCGQRLWTRKNVRPSACDSSFCAETPWSSSEGHEDVGGTLLYPVRDGLLARARRPDGPAGRPPGSRRARDTARGGVIGRRLGRWGSLASRKQNACVRRDAQALRPLSFCLPCAPTGPYARPFTTVVLVCAPCGPVCVIV